VYKHGEFKPENCYMIEQVGQLEKGRVAVIVEPVHWDTNTSANNK